MGLMIHSLSEIPIHERRDYYLFLLDYGWHEPLSEALRNNFKMIASKAAKNKSAVIMGFEGSHFNDEVLSWQNINGEDATEILPAIMITTIAPFQFKEIIFQTSKQIKYAQEKMLLIPLKKFCTTTTDVIELIEKLFNDIKSEKSLLQFEIAKELKKGKGKAFMDSLILKPTAWGMGIDIKQAIKSLTK